jgi:N-acetylglucosaminyldiphosphoundecaprenol N-acetyl-beta-D-mannosaminyltransferase
MVSSKKEPGNNTEEIRRLESTLQDHLGHRILRSTAPLRISLRDWLYMTVEIVISLLVVVFLALPVFILLLFVKLISGRNIFSGTQVIGYEGIPITINYFNVPFKPIRSLALYYYILSGKLALISTSMRRDMSTNSSLENNYLHRLKPGVFSLWQVRKNSNIAHEGQTKTDWEYCFTRRPAADLLLLLRSAPAYLFASAIPAEADFINLLDVTFSNISMMEAVQRIKEAAQCTEKNQSIFFVNPDCLNTSCTDNEYLKLLQQADYVYPDGIGIAIACKILGTPLKENINGTDMLPFLSEMAAQNGLSFFLLGGKPGVAETMAANMTQKFNATIAGCHHGYFDHDHESEQITEKINNSGAAIVLVAFGAPLQEKWISEHQKDLNAGVALGVGGLFDFYSGNTKRAPRWLREIGLEWVYRILQEPGRMWKRYVIGNPLFLTRVLFWKIRKHRQQRSTS